MRTPCRLHFGLLSLRDEGGDRRFGGVGLMVSRPDIAVVVRPSAGFTAEGPMADRAAAFARTFARRCGRPIDGAHIQVLRAPPSHAGLGTGTQLGMAVARAMGELSGMDGLGPAQLASLVGRGQRSAIGTYGFVSGGLIVEGGKREPEALSPLLLRRPFPDAWRVVLVRPNQLAGLSGARERRAFSELPPIDQAVTDRLCRLVLLGLLPAVVEQDLGAFGESLYEMQQTVGRCFAGAQGGVYAHPLLERIVEYTRRSGVCGVGQSSWGPTLYAVCGDQAGAQALRDDLAAEFELDPDEAVVTAADNEGGRVG